MKHSLITRKTFSSLSAMTIASLTLISFTNIVNAQEYQVVSGDTLWRVAQNHGVSVAELKTWNQLSSDIITVNQTLVVSSPNAENTSSPVPSTDSISDTDTEINNTVSSSELMTTSNTSNVSSVNTFYTVQPGDSLYKIAAQYNVTISDLQKWNNINGGWIFPNQKIIVKNISSAATPAQSTVSTTKPADTTQANTSSTNTTITANQSSVSSNITRPTQSTSTATPVNTLYTIQPGDSLYKIATQYNVTISDLQKWNNISGNLIFPNQKIIVKRTISTTATTTTAQPVTNTVRPTEKPSTTTTPTGTSSNTQNTRPANIPNETPREIQMNKMYTIQPGDSLYKIAAQHNVTISDLQKWNNISGSLIFPNQKIIVSKEKTTVTTTDKPQNSNVATNTSASQPTNKPNTTSTDKPQNSSVTTNTSASQPTNKPNTTSTDKPQNSSVTTNISASQPTNNNPATTPIVSTYKVQSGDTLYQIAIKNGITVAELMEWNGLLSPNIYIGQQLSLMSKNTTVQSDTPAPTTTTARPVISNAAAVQAILNQYKDSPVYVYYESLVDNSTAGLRENTAIYGASVPKLLLAAYTQNRIERGLLNWDTQYTYTAAVNQRPESYEPYGSGTIQFDGIGTTYTVREIVRRTMQNSDNIGSNMLLHYVGYADKADFDQFVQSLTGLPKYSFKLTPKQVNNVMKYVSQQKEQYAFNALSHTDYDNTKLDVLPVTTHQKIGAWWPYYNHTSGVVEGEKPFVLTVLSDYVSDSAIGQLVKKIYAAVVR
ncbi:LysM peptidoglycan-binding domain-containing protein [Aerococcaceae bacterium zg-ZJ1578]|uniref:LysM peptidoglycan-binding domain-containing protein n=1 Tax=Aerococcaceae bacterium zg-252 TaxID=2796928 RepID=UPI001A212122|nr:LysM peptidoglycan-binding domain-containing protein [Aerococcaceae bacterium zg-1578]